MDEKYGEYWHVVLGRHFGCYSIYESHNYVYLYYENVAYLLYKAS